MTEQEYYECLSVIDSFASLSKNWCGRNSDPIPDKIFTYSKKLLLYLASFNVTHLMDCPAPEIFPTSNQSIKFKWYMNECSCYLELEIKDDDINYYAEFNSDKDNISNHLECTLCADNSDYCDIIRYIKETFFDVYKK